MHCYRRAQFYDQRGINRTAICSLDVLKREAHHQRDLGGKGWLELKEIRLAHANQWRTDRMVRATFGRQRQPRGRDNQQIAATLVTAIIERIQFTCGECVN